MLLSLTLCGRGSLQIGHLSETVRSRVRQFMQR